MPRRPGQRCRLGRDYWYWDVAGKQTPAVPAVSVQVDAGQRLRFRLGGILMSLQLDGMSRMTVVNLNPTFSDLL